MPQIRLDGEDKFLLNEVREMLKDDKAKKSPDAKTAVIMCLNIVKDMLYQENGADVRIGKKKVEGNF